jgi:hypothetical protein
MRDTTSRIASRTIALFVVLAMASTAHAKGSFQAEGIISDFQRRGDEVTLKFTGKISSTYATAPAGDSRREWKDLTVIAAGITLKIGDWTRRNKPDETADRAEVDREVDRISADLSDLVKAGGAVRISVDNPQLTFSNIGELVRASGTFIYAVALSH